MRILLTLLVMFFSINAYAGTQTGLSSMERENGMLGDEAVALIQKHWPDDKSGKLNFHYWWKIDGLYYAIHQHNFRGQPDIHAYIEEVITSLVNETNTKVYKEIEHTADKIVALSSIGMNRENIELFLSDVDPIFVNLAFAMLTPVE